MDFMEYITRKMKDFIENFQSFLEADWTFERWEEFIKTFKEEEK